MTDQERIAMLREALEQLRMVTIRPADISGAHMYDNAVAVLAKTSAFVESLPDAPPDTKPTPPDMLADREAPPRLTPREWAREQATGQAASEEADQLRAENAALRATLRADLATALTVCPICQRRSGHELWCNGTEQSRVQALAQRGVVEDDSVGGDSARDAGVWRTVGVWCTDHQTYHACVSQEDVSALLSAAQRVEEARRSGKGLILSPALSGACDALEAACAAFDGATLR